MNPKKVNSDIFSDTVPEKDKRETAIAHMEIRSDSGLSADRMAAVAEDDAGQQAMTKTQPEPEQEQPVAGQTTIRVLIKSQ